MRRLSGAEHSGGGFSSAVTGTNQFGIGPLSIPNPFLSIPNPFPPLSIPSPF
jgi:hypothetical protein